MRNMTKWLPALALTGALTILTGCNLFGKPAPSAEPAELIDITDPAANAASTPTEPTPVPERPAELTQEEADGGREDDGNSIEYDHTQPIPEKMAQAQMKNPDVVGWLKVPNTRIDYPVLVGTDNKYYLEHNAEGKNSKSGAIFMDYRNTRPDERRHIVIYGHNMKNGSMFHDLNNFKLKNFIQNCGPVDLWLYGQHYKFQVYGQFLATTDIDFIRTDFADDMEFMQYMTELNGLSKFPNTQTFGVGDIILTMSTCTYEYDNSRCVVQGVLVPDEPAQ